MDLASHMGIGRPEALAARSKDLALAFIAAILLAPILALGGPLEKCRGRVDLDACRNVPEIIASKGYPVEVHKVVTEDGYILNVHRIPHGRTGRGRHPRPVVFLQHGLVCSSVDWVINLPHQSLAYILADAGYDVWMGNVRGNMYTSHITLNKKNRKFWDFSFDDMIALDLPAMIDYVLEATDRRSLFYVGHSQGTQILFGLLSERPEYNRKIRLFCALAPVTTVTYMTSPLRIFAPMGAAIKRVLVFFGRHHFVKSSRLLKHTARTTCRKRSSRRFCESSLFVIAGMEERTINMSRLPVIMSNFPAGTSVKNIAHYGQLVMSKRFQKYDYGLVKNLLFYGQRRPPEYDLSHVTAPVALFYSLNDWFCSLKDVRQLHKRLRNIVLSYQVPDPRFTHLDFNFGVLARRQVYEPMMRFMSGYLSGVERDHTAPIPVDRMARNEPVAPIPVEIVAGNEPIATIPNGITSDNEPTARIPVDNMPDTEEPSAPHSVDLSPVEE